MAEDCVNKIALSLKDKEIPPCPFSKNLLQKLYYLAYNVANIGIGKNYSWLLSNKIQISNAVLVFSYPLVFIDFLYNCYAVGVVGFETALPSLMADVVWAISLPVIPLGHYFKQHQISFAYSFTLPTVMASILYLFFGLELVVAPVYLVMIVLAIFFFEKLKARIFFIGFILLNYTGSQWYLDYYPHILDSVNMVAAPHFFFIFCTFSISAITIRVLNENKKQLDKANDLLIKLEEKNKELERFAYITSHDLKEPLRSISGFSDLLRRRLRGNTDKNVWEYLDYIKDSSIQLNDLVESILNFTRIPDKDIALGEVSMDEVIYDVQQKLYGMIKDSSCEIYCPVLPLVFGEKTLLACLFQNLVQNAIKYNTNPIPKIEIGIKENDDFFTFSVKDNGIGIDSQYFNLIFEPFKKLHSKQEYKGSGVGLSICRKIVHLHQGKIWVESTVGEGTVFYFTIKKLG